MKGQGAELQDRRESLGWVVAISLWFATTLILLVLGQTVFWADSELWPSTVSRDLFARDKGFDLGVKWFFHTLLFFNYQWVKYTDLLPIQSLRFFFSLIGASVLALCFYLCRRRTESVWGALVLTMGVAACWTFVERGFRVRSDMLASIIILVALFWQSRVKDWEVRECLRLPLFWALAILATPKAIYLVLAHALLVLRPPNWRSASLTKHPWWKLPETWILLSLSTLFLLLNGLTSLGYAWQYYYKSFFADETGYAYWDINRFAYIIRLFQNNPYVWMILTVRVFLSFWDIFLGSGEQKRWAGFFLAILAAMFIHPERMPFFIASLLPFLAIGVAADIRFQFLFKSLQRSNWGIGLLLILCLGLFAHGARRAVWLSENHDNLDQLQVSRQLGRELGELDLFTVFDSAGVIPYRKTFNWYLGPAQNALNAQVAQEIVHRGVDVLLRTQRFERMGPEAGLILGSRYTDLGRGLMVKTMIQEFEGQALRVNGADLTLSLRKHFGDSIPRSQSWWMTVIDIGGQDITASSYWTLKGSPRLLTGREILRWGIDPQDADRLDELILPSNSLRLKVRMLGRVGYLGQKRLEELFRFDNEL